MSVQDSSFDDEAELERWVFGNCGHFFGDVVLLPGCQIATPAGKRGVPDGFVFNFAERIWWVVECELVAHRVWPHIAEQLSRFVVAIRNPATLRRVRDQLFEKLIQDELDDWAARSLQTTRIRLLQQLELFLDAVRPSLAVFIDETNQDLYDFLAALNSATEVYRVKKLIVNGAIEYYSPDKQPVLSNDPEEDRDQGATLFDVIELLGGGEALSSRRKLYKLFDGRVVKVQYSKLHERHNTYWYGINPSTLQNSIDAGCTDYVFVLGDQGFVVLEASQVRDTVSHASTSLNNTGAIRHFHIYISPPPVIALTGLMDSTDIDVSDRFVAFS